MQAGLVFLFERRGGLKLCLFIRAALEALEHAPWVFRCALQSFENPVSHFHRRLEGCFLTAVLAVREVLGELIPLAADAESPPLEGGGSAHLPRPAEEGGGRGSAGRSSTS